MAQQAGLSGQERPTARQRSAASSWIFPALPRSSADRQPQIGTRPAACGQWLSLGFEQAKGQRSSHARCGRGVALSSEQTDFKNRSQATSPASSREQNRPQRLADPKSQLQRVPIPAPCGRKISAARFLRQMGAAARGHPQGRVPRCDQAGLQPRPLSKNSTGEVIANGPRLLDQGQLRESNSAQQHQLSTRARSAWLSAQHDPGRRKSASGQQQSKPSAVCQRADQLCRSVDAGGRPAHVRCRSKRSVACECRPRKP